MIGKGRFEEARRSLAWALQIDPKLIELSPIAPTVPSVAWHELFKYPRSLAVSCLTGLTQTGNVGLTLWITTLLVLQLKVSPAEASFLVIWFGVVGIAGRFFCAWLSDAMGRAPSIALVCLTAGLATSLSGYLSDAHIGTVSVFYIMVLVSGFFGGGNYAIVGPYMAEVWPSKLRTGGMGVGYGVGNLGKFIGPAGLALIAGSSNYVSPRVTLGAPIPGMNFFAFWYLLGALAIWLIGFETRGRTIDEIDRALSARVKAPAA